MAYYNDDVKEILRQESVLYEAIRAAYMQELFDENGDAIPGLYVIGNDSGSYFANEYPNLATGMACGRTVTFGRVIGRALAKKA